MTHSHFQLSVTLQLNLFSWSYCKGSNVFKFGSKEDVVSFSRTQMPSDLNGSIKVEAHCLNANAHPKS